MSGDGRRRLRIDAEAGWLATAGERTTILRLAGIYGPRQNALVNLAAGTARRIVKSMPPMNAEALPNLPPKPERPLD
eukprot:gene64263-87898_t